MYTLPAPYRAAGPAAPPSPVRAAPPAGRAAGLGLIAAALRWRVAVGRVADAGNQSFEAKWADWLRSHHAAVARQRGRAVLLQPSRAAQRGPAGRVSTPSRPPGPGGSHPAGDALRSGGADSA